MSIPRWLKNENVTGLPDPDKEQNTEMKSVVSAANDAQRVVSKKRGDYESHCQKRETNLLDEIN